MINIGGGGGGGDSIQCFQASRHGALPLNVGRFDSLTEAGLSVCMHRCVFVCARVRIRLCVRACARCLFSHRMCPVFQLSNVTGENLPLLKNFLNLLSTRMNYPETSPAEFQIDDTYMVPVSLKCYTTTYRYGE